MTPPNDSTPAPKKLKLTLKLNSSSSSSSSCSTPMASQLNSSPVKPAVTSENETTVGLGELPSGLGNLKGRGRPKKAAEPKPKPPPLGTNSNNRPSDLTSAPTTFQPGATANEYTADLKSLVSSMKSFKPRSWSLHRPLNLSLPTVSGNEVTLPSGLWCTFTCEPGSAHLPTDPVESSTATATTGEFMGTCQCGKVFSNRSKYRKHVKIHEKGETKPVPVPPVISLKIKLNTHS